MEEGVRIAHAGLEARVRSRQRETEAQEDRDREHMLQQIRSPLTSASLSPHDKRSVETVPRLDEQNLPPIYTHAFAYMGLLYPPSVRRRMSSEEGAEFVEQFYQAHHLLSPRHIAEHKDINREPKLYQEVRVRLGPSMPLPQRLHEVHDALCMTHRPAM